MKFSIATISIPGSLDEKIDAIALAGFQGVELFDQDLLCDFRSPEEIGRRLKAAELECFAFQPFRNFEGLTGALRDKALARAARKLDLLGELGCDMMLVCSSIHPEALDDSARSAADLHGLGEMAAARGIRIGYEALAWGRHVRTHRQAWDLVRRADCTSVGLVLDSFHTLAPGGPGEGIDGIPADKLFFVQLADAPRLNMDLAFWSKNFRTLPGQGDLDLDEFVRHVLTTGYDGPLSIEIFNKALQVAAPGPLARHIHRALTALVERVREDAPGGVTWAPALPKAAAPKDIAFVEIGGGAGGVGDCARLLDSMGFADIGPHPAREARLFAQGQLRIVLAETEEGDSVAAPFVKSVAGEVEDYAGLVARAEGLGAETREDGKVPGRLIQDGNRRRDPLAVRLLEEGDGLHRVFGAAEGAPGEAALLSFDHLDLTCPQAEMHAHAVFLSSVFGLTRQEVADFASRSAPVRSQALCNPEGTITVLLHSQEARYTPSGDFVPDRSEGRAQHVAFATRDIFETARRLWARGFRALAIPGNYYDDLAARGEIDDEQIAQMRAFGILYDRRGSEAFLHLFSPRVRGGFFFEIVERRGGYAGFGTANEAVRSAAHRRQDRDADGGAA